MVCCRICVVKTEVLSHVKLHKEEILAARKNVGFEFVIAETRGCIDIPVLQRYALLANVIDVMALTCSSAVVRPFE